MSKTKKKEKEKAVQSEIKIEHGSFTESLNL